MKQTKNKSSWSWKIDENDLKNQIENYRTLKITKSYRGISVLIISVLIGLSLILSFVGIYADFSTIFWGIVIYLPIAFFVYKGHRWAIIALMALWTFEKIYSVYGVVQSGSGSVVIPMIWWFIVMPYFWKALRVENERKKLVPVIIGNVELIFCHKCGTQIEVNSRFCHKCGAKIITFNE